MQQFLREDVQDGKESETMVRVWRKSLHIFTYWSLEKFEAKLVQLRELYVAAYQVTYLSIPICQATS